VNKLNSFHTFISRKQALPAFALGGLLIAVLLVKLQPGPAHGTAALRVSSVEVVGAQVMPTRALAVGFGEVSPSLFLRANAEVTGRIVYVHPELKQGAFLKEGTPVLRIDDTSYVLALAQARADLAANRANKEELSVEKSNTEASLVIARRNLKIGENELARKKKLLKQGSVSRSSADKEEQSVLRLRQELQNLLSQDSLMPSRGQVIDAQIARAEAQVKDSDYKLKRTEILLPFAARVGEVHVEVGQFVMTNSPLFDASGMAQVEISAELPLMHARYLFQGLSVNGEGMPGLAGLDFSSLGLEARVSLIGGPPEAKWQGRVVRIGDALDNVSRTISMVVAVDSPYTQVIPGQRPPLIRGMYTRIELLAPATPAMVIPRRALHQGKVYVAHNNKLQIREVELEYHQGEFSVISAGIRVGEQVIVTDLVPALAGMPLEVSTDKALQDRLPILAMGEGGAP